MATIEYGYYRRGDHWKNVEKMAMENAESRCQACKADTDLAVIHRNLDCLGQERPEDVAVICGACYEKYRDRLPEITGDRIVRIDTAVKLVLSGMTCPASRLEDVDITSVLRELLLKDAKECEKPADTENMNWYRQGKRAAYFHVLYRLGLIGDGISGELMPRRSRSENASG